MEDATALRVAIQLLHMPANARMARDAALPAGIPFLLRIATGDAEALATGAALTERPAEVLQRAARFFIEQAMWHPKADSYRVLGAAPGATAADLKRNMALMMTWLHPDHDSKDEQAVFAVRVTNAWNDLKTPERRAQYSAALASEVEVEAARKRRRARRQREHMARMSAQKPSLFRSLFRRWLGRPQ